MGKAGRLIRNTLRKDFLLSFLATFAAVLGIPATGISLLGGNFSLRATLLFTLVALTVSALINRSRWSPSWRAKDILLGRKILRCPCNLDLARRAAKLAKLEFGRSNTIPPVDYEPLRARNRYILTCLIESNGTFLGYFDVFPLKKAFAELFLQGRVTEKDLTHENIFSGHDMRRAKYLYIGGIAACDSDTTVGKGNGSILIWGLLKYLEHFFGGSNAYVFASAASDDGEEMLRSLGIPLICDATIRSDKQRLYGVQLSRERVSELLSYVPDYTLLCSADWEPTKASVVDPIPRRPAFPRKKRSALAV